MVTGIASRAGRAGTAPVVIARNEGSTGHAERLEPWQPKLSIKILFVVFSEPGSAECPLVFSDRFWGYAYASRF
jgi:hypothetical protein